MVCKLWKITHCDDNIITTWNECHLWFGYGDFIIIGAKLIAHVQHIPRIVCFVEFKKCFTLKCRHNERDGVSDHQPYGCLPSRLIRRKSKKTSKCRVIGLCAGNSPVTGEFPARRASNAENISIWWRHQDFSDILKDYFTGTGAIIRLQ